MTRTVHALAATLILALAAAAPASARTHSGGAAAAPDRPARFTIRGAGFGHGVGMSQYGALGYAEHGWSAAAILAHYYTGTALGTTDPGQGVRVLLVEKAGAARISGARQGGTRKLDPAVTYTVRRHGLAQVDLFSGARRVATFTAPLQVAGSAGVTTLGGHGAYRGVLEFAPGAFGGLRVVNAVALDDYIQGVVPAESPPTWPLEALKAQAVAARTYAITTSRGADFDHYADTRSQVYGGVSVETPASNQAVAETRGRVVTYQGQPVVTYFFSTSGGRTEDVENTALGTAPLPWLRSVDDPYDSISPRHRWRPVTMRLASAGRKLRGLVRGSFRGIRVVRRGASPRIVQAEVIGTRGSTIVSGATLRERLGLYDTWAYFRSITSHPATPGKDRPDPRAGDPSGGSRAYAARAAAAGAIAGAITPARAGALVAVQARHGATWRTVDYTLTAGGGGYDWVAARPGTYRVRLGADAGPPVTIR